MKVAQKMADSQQQEYIADLQKSRAQEEAIRTVHQHSADKAMDVSILLVQAAAVGIVLSLSLTTEGTS